MEGDGVIATPVSRLSMAWFTVVETPGAAMPEKSR
jgi:hypothetical protein